MATENIENKTFWSYEETAAYLSVSVRFVRDVIVKEVPVIFLVDRTKFFEREDVYGFLQSRKIKAEAIF